MFSKLFKKKPKKVIVVHLYVKTLADEAAKKHLEETANGFKDIVGEHASVIVMPSYTDTRVEVLPL